MTSPAAVTPVQTPPTPLIVQQVAAVRSQIQGLGSQISTDAQAGNFSAILSSIEGVTGQLTSATPSTSAASLSTLTGAGGTSGSSTSSSSALLGSSALFGSSGLGGSSTAGSVTGASVVADASKYLGVPYQWGGTSVATGFDCSGLTQHVYGDLGITLPRTSQEQVNVGQPVASLAQAQPGDLLFFEPSASGPGHVAIYMGNNEMIAAPHTGTDVQVQQVPTTPCAIRRIIPTAGSVDTSATTAATTSLGGTSASAGSAAMSVPSNLAPLFLSAGATYGVSPTLLAAVAQTESSFNPSAVSSAGAEGLMQIMPTTAQGLGINPMDPAQAIDGAAQILAGNIKEFGSVPLALAAYNAGAGAVQEYGGIPPYPETQAYVTKIMGLVSGSAA